MAAKILASHDFLWLFFASPSSVLSPGLGGSQSRGSDSWVKVQVPPSAKSAAACPLPQRIHLVVRRPSTPTGPRAWILAVLIPTSAPDNKGRGVKQSSGRV